MVLVVPCLLCLEFLRVFLCALTTAITAVTGLIAPPLLARTGTATGPVIILVTDTVTVTVMVTALVSATVRPAPGAAPPLETAARTPAQLASR